MQVSNADLVFRHVQFMSESSEGHSTNDHQNQLNAKFVKDTSKYWYKPHISRDDGKAKNITIGYLWVLVLKLWPDGNGIPLST